MSGHLCVCVCICTMTKLGSHEGSKKAMDALELELQPAENHHMSAGKQIRTLKEHQELLTAELSLQSLDFATWYFSFLMVFHNFYLILFFAMLGTRGEICNVLVKL